MRGVSRTLRLSALVLVALLYPFAAVPQPKPLREINTSYPLGGSTSFFWVAHRSGAFEKHGLKLNPVYIRGSVTALQSLLAKELSIQMEAGPAGVRAWARGAKEIVLIGAVGNKLDYVLVAKPSIRKAEDLKGKKIGVSQIGASSDFIARYAVQQLGLNPDKDVTILTAGGVGQRWAALTAGHIDATVTQPPYTLLARKSNYPVLLDISKQDFQYPISAVFTTRSFIKAEPETVMSFMRGLADGMDFYRDEKNKDRVIKFLGEYYRSNAVEELEETRRAYSQLTPGLPVITPKAIENVIRNEKDLAAMTLNPMDILDLSFLQRLEEERKARAR
ncbi:MAG TPA: ABC transporter substrate-binding protein [Candidatus Binatia bacterium]|jgi:ABC-type nitrate/sulfonate/bicarbonate transport system substrate-binding protein